MRPFYLTVVLVASVFYNYSSAAADVNKAAADATNSRRGLITSGQCPLTCRQLGLGPENCREWQQGEKCLVEDFSQPAGHRSMIRVSPRDMIIERKSEKSGAQLDALLEGRRGLVTSASCPYNCKIAGLSEQSCREWRQGNTCMVEDFMQPAGHRSMLRVP